MQIYQGGVSTYSKSRKGHHMTRIFRTNSTSYYKHEATVTCLIAHKATA